ncbi:MAG: hypothetical protein KF911_13805 [Pseudomonadales bacterium]|nr:hypothetical protein [Pseudomonadales bacterium]
MPTPSGMETVGSHTVPAAVHLRADQTCGDALAALLAARPVAAELLLVVAPDGRLVGTVPLARLVALPWALARAGVDPAYGSGPLATICQDILSLLVYLGVVALIGVG